MVWLSLNKLSQQQRSLWKLQFLFLMQHSIGHVFIVRTCQAIMKNGGMNSSIRKLTSSHGTQLVRKKAGMLFMIRKYKSSLNTEPQRNPLTTSAASNRRPATLSICLRLFTPDSITFEKPLSKLSLTKCAFCDFARQLVTRFWENETDHTTKAPPVFF